MYGDDDLDLNDDFENKKFNPEMECTEKIAKGMIVPEISKLLKGKELFTEEEMLDAAFDKISEHSLIYNFYDIDLQKFTYDDIRNGGKKGTRNELLETINDLLKEDNFLKEHTNGYISFLEQSDNVNFLSNDGLKQTYNEFKEIYYAKRMFRNFKDKAPNSQEIIEFANKEKLNDLNYDFTKAISLYIKGTKNYQAAELVSKGDEQMVSNYVDFVINKVKSKDPKGMEYYKQMESLENNHKLPTKNGSPTFRVLSETIFRTYSRS